MANLFSPVTEVAPSLPITDIEQLRSALAQSDPSILLMVLAHFAGDDPLLAQLAPYISSIFELPKEVPAELLGELHERLFGLLTQNPPPIDRAPDETLMRKMLSVAVGEPVGDEFIPMLNEQMGFAAPDIRSKRA